MEPISEIREIFKNRPGIYLGYGGASGLGFSLARKMTGFDYLYLHSTCTGLKVGRGVWGSQDADRYRGTRFNPEMTMTIKERAAQITEHEATTAAQDSYSVYEFCRKINIPCNGGGSKLGKKILEKYQIDISHFDGGATRQKKWETIIKICPVCGERFETLKGHPREKIVCSRACSNTHFRSGKNHPNYKHGGQGDPEYRRICLEHHEAKCIICGWDKNIDVHHLDENHNNNNPDNLVPLCPNHHRMIHTNKYKEEVILAIQQAKLR